MAYDHRCSPSLDGIAFRELMSAIFHAQDPRNRRVKWFAVNLSSTWPPPPPRDAHLAVSHSILEFCTGRGERRIKLCSLLYVWKGTTHSCETLCFSTWPAFRSSVAKMRTISNSTRRAEKENNVKMERERKKKEEFRGIRIETFCASNRKNGNCRAENWSRCARSLTRDCSMNDGLTHDITG